MLLVHKPRKCIIVLGRPRSGTSLVAGILHHLGVNMGNVLVTPRPANPLGFYEDEELMKIHDLMIGRMWHNPDLGDAERFIEIYKNLIEDRKHQTLWGVKDPRLCFTLQYLLDALDEYDTKLILTQRPTVESAKSMIVRSYAVNDPVFRMQKLSKKRPPGATFIAANVGGPKDELQHAIEVCEKYDNARTEVVRKSKLEFLDVAYSDIVKNPKVEISKICDFIPHQTSMDKAISFVQPDLKHF